MRSLRTNRPSAPMTLNIVSLTAPGPAARASPTSTAMSMSLSRRAAPRVRLPNSHARRTVGSACRPRARSSHNRRSGPRRAASGLSMRHQSTRDRHRTTGRSAQRSPATLDYKGQQGARPGGPPPRSTKAGGREPRRHVPPAAQLTLYEHGHAQRRSGREPRRHSCRPVTTHSWIVRRLTPKRLDNSAFEAPRSR